MPLLSIFASDPDSVGKFTIEQVVSTAGDGSLKDHSACSSELREYLGMVGTATLGQYANHCLDVSFTKSGMVLQDVVNELGRRLDYDVANGRYQGVSNDIGFDGLWHSPEGHSLVVEVKTTDAYRLSLDKLAEYQTKLASAGQLKPSSSILVIVGRQDTGELEAQIRGSRHAWDIRMISVEALIKLVVLKENTEAEETGLKIRSLLAPIEYTRLDRMVDVMFTTVTDVEEPADSVLLSGGLEATPSVSRGDAPSSPTGVGIAAGVKGTWQFTDSQVLQAKREEIIAALGVREQANFVRKSRALYWNAGHQVRAACAMSKRYGGKNQAPYWYAYHPQWHEFLGDAERGYFVLGCMDRDVAYAVPHSEIADLLSNLHTTTRDGGTYWHIHLAEKGGDLAIALPKGSGVFDLSPYRFAAG